MLAGFLSMLALASTATAQMTIQVGAEMTSPGGVYQFIPNNATVTEGTVITFAFTGNPGNHSVTQSTFNAPCTPAPGGFDSGWILIENTLAVTPTWNLTITNATEPIWFFCKQLNPLVHCNVGMVGAFNAPTSGSNTLEAFQAAAAKAGSSIQSVGGLVGIGASASAGIGPVSADATLFGVPSGALAATGSAATSGSAAASGSGTSASATSPGASGTSTSTGTGTTSSTATSTGSSASTVGASFFSLAIATFLGISLA